VKIEPRSLHASERVVLDALLSNEFVGAVELRAQMDTAMVVGQCDCGCPTIDIESRGDPAVALRDARLAPVELRVMTAGEEPPGEVVLFLTDGRLSSLEYVFYSDEPPGAWPTRDYLEIVNRLA
jgi:hypothetical protein